MPRPGFNAGVLEQSTIPGTNKKISGFSALFTTNNPEHPFIIVTYEELSFLQTPQGGMVTAAPVYQLLGKLGIPGEDIGYALNNLRQSMAWYRKTADPGRAFASIGDWKSHYMTRNRREAPKPVRVGRPQRADHLAALLSGNRHVRRMAVG